LAKSEQLPVAEARAGKPEAWEVLFGRYQLPLYVYVFELVRDQQASLDIVQETFVAAVRHIAGLQADENFGSWLFGIAHQKCVQLWRKQNREARWRDEIAGAPAKLESSPDDLLLRREQEAEFLLLLDQLPLPQRTAPHCCCTSWRISRWRKLPALPARASARSNHASTMEKEPSESCYRRHCHENAT
jgi:RNA polymerase sigma-70 factor (ECF subfamily)